MSDLEALKALWGHVPARFVELCQSNAQPVPILCAFYAPEQVVAGEGREYGMVPSFLPIAESQAGDGQYGLYANSPDAEQWPVLFAATEENFLRPVASSFDAFLRWLALTARFEASLEEDSDDESAQEAGEQDEETEIARAVNAQELARLGIPADLLTGKLPRNDSEFYRRLVALDAGDAVSLCQLGCANLLRRENKAALERFQQAARAMPWFGDPHYLTADVHRDQERYAEAVPHWWATVQQPIAFCTRTWEWNLGEDYPEAEIYEVAADCLTQYARFASPDLRAAPLWQVVTEADPYNPDARLTLGRNLLRHGDKTGAEREFWNALTLSGSEDRRLTEHCYDALADLYAPQNRTRDLRLIQHDRALPMPSDT